MRALLFAPECYHDEMAFAESHLIELYLRMRKAHGEYPPCMNAEGCQVPSCPRPEYDKFRFSLTVERAKQDDYSEPKRELQ